MDVQKKSVLKNVIIIWIVSLVVVCVCNAVMMRGFSAAAGTGRVPGTVFVAFLLPFLVVLVDGILLGITLTDQPQRKRKIVLFSIFIAVSFVLSLLIAIAIGGVIIDGMDFSAVFAFSSDTGWLRISCIMAAIYAIEGILFGLLSSLITNKVFRKKSLPDNPNG